MKQLYYYPIFPCISYATIAWGSAYKTHINKVQTKPNHSIMLIFFARTFGDQSDSALSWLNLLDVLTVNHFYTETTSSEIHAFSAQRPTTKLVSWFLLIRQWSTWILHQARYASRQNLYISKLRTNCGKQTIAYSVHKTKKLILAHLNLN